MIDTIKFKIQYTDEQAYALAAKAFQDKGTLTSAFPRASTMGGVISLTPPLAAAKDANQKAYNVTVTYDRRRQGIYFQVSIPALLWGDNTSTGRIGDISKAIAFLEQELEMTLKAAILTRVDISASFYSEEGSPRIMEELLERKYGHDTDTHRKARPASSRKTGDSESTSQIQSRVFKSESRCLQFYSKFDERARILPTEAQERYAPMQDMFTRVELQILRHLDRALDGKPVLLYDLLKPEILHRILGIFEAEMEGLRVQGQISGFAGDSMKEALIFLAALGLKTMGDPRAWIDTILEKNIPRGSASTFRRNRAHFISLLTYSSGTTSESTGERFIQQIKDWAARVHKSIDAEYPRQAPEKPAD